MSPEERAVSYAEQLIQTSPNRPTADQGALAACIKACVSCAQACTACADACLGEPDASVLVRCIRLNLDCADLCAATGAILSRQVAAEPSLLRAALQASKLACQLCGDECAEHARYGMAHCRVCEEACRHCEQACERLLEELKA
jgi:hypothetical protein